MTAFAPRHCAPVTASDSVDMGPCEWLSFTNSGAQTLTVTMVGGETVSGIILPSGRYEMMVTRVWNTGTSVANIFRYWA